MAGPKTEGNGQIVKSEGAAMQKPGDKLASMLDKMRGEIARALPKHVTPDRMVRVATTALRTTRNLSECDMASFLGCVIQAAQLGLEVNTPLGQAYLIPRRNNKRGGYECTLQLGYQGMIDLARRSGMVRAIYAFAVYEGDRFHVTCGLDPKIDHEPCGEGDAQKLTHVYAVGVLGDGAWDRQFAVLTRKEVEAIRRRSAARDGGPWNTDYAEMAKKTAVRRLFKYLPKSAEMARAITVDEAQVTTQVVDPDVLEALQSEGQALPDEADAIDTTEAKGD